MSTPEGRRDHALLSVLYNTGARIQEVLDLAPALSGLKRLRMSVFSEKVEKNALARYGRKQLRS